uniref:Uncharacterized protein n=1 Tax=Arundo donax TaxID=35708 RepID=A0A0A8Y6S2_ARUDO
MAGGAVRQRVVQHAAVFCGAHAAAGRGALGGGAELTEHADWPELVEHTDRSWSTRHGQQSAARTFLAADLARG